MSDRQIAVALQEVPEPIDDLPWREKWFKLFMFTRLGHEGMMLDKIQQQTRSVLRLAEQAKTGNFQASPESAEDEMGVSIGNEVHYHVQGGDTSTVAAAPALGKLATAGIGVLLGGGGVGLATLLSSLLSGQEPTPPPVPPAIVAPGDSTDWKLGVQVTKEP